MSLSTSGYSSFLMLFVLFVVALEGNVIERINFTEGVFMIFALGLHVVSVRTWFVLISSM